MIKWFLLLIKNVATCVLRSLVVVELSLTCVAAILGKTQFGLAPIGRGDRGKIIVVGGRAVSVECDLGFVEALLVAISADLFHVRRCSDRDRQVSVPDRALVADEFGRWRWWESCSISVTGRLMGGLERSRPSDVKALAVIHAQFSKQVK